MPHVIRLKSETDFEGWRDTARSLATAEIDPADVTWSVEGDPADLFGAHTPGPAKTAAASSPRFSVPAAFVDWARYAILHRDPQRFARLYRLLWRLRRNPELVHQATDAGVAQIAAMAKSVGRDEHKMHAFVRFREIGEEDATRFVAWFEPEHHIVELTAPFFARRFGDMAWSILTPDACSHFDGGALSITPGVDRSLAPSQDRLDDIWRQYYASIFNPARLKVKAMQSEMPKKYWRNLPEASLIVPLIATARERMQQMVAKDASQPHRSPQRRAHSPATATESDDALEALRREAAECRACPLWKDATQTVFGEGPRHAPVMLVGEQPGDKEDLAGRPFVGPAGQMLDRALKDAGINRDRVYVTNAVKHFKFAPRGKVRLHQRPNTQEIRACRPWYERERALIRPSLIVAMGATAAQSVLGKITPVNRSRGRLIDLDEATHALVTVHPSYLLRLPDAEAKRQEYLRFVEDLRIVAAALGKAAA